MVFKRIPYKIPSVEELLSARVYFGHPSRRWHPATAPYIFRKIKGFHVFDLEKVRDKLAEACEFLYNTAREGGTVLFVGLRRQSKELIEEEARRVGAMFMTGRWIGGFFTNFSEVKKNISKLEELERGLAKGEFDHYTKKERLGIEREIARLERMFGGVRGLEGLPQVLFLASARKGRTAAREAQRVGVPVVAVVDSDADPQFVDYPIPGNDDSLKSLSVLVRTVADAVEAGYQKGEVKGETLDGARGRKSKVKGDELEGEGLGVLGLSTRTKNALEKAGIKSVEALRALPREELLKIKGIGEKAVEEIQRVVANFSPC